MRRTLAALTLLATAGAAFPAGALAGAPSAAAEPLKLEASALAASTQLGQTISIDLKVTNTSGAPVTFTLPTPCHSPLAVSVHSEAGKVADLRAPGESGPCAQMVLFKTLQPGDALSQRVVWPTAEGGVAPGRYTLQVATQYLDDGAPQRLSIPLEVTGLSDISAHWAGQSVLQGLRRGFVAGYPDGTFRPEGRVTRAELVKLLVVARGLRPLPGKASGFQDTAGHWAESSGLLAAAAEAGLIHPADYALRLEPDRALDRQETAAVIVRAMAQEGAALSTSPATLPFADKESIAPWFGGYVMQASAAAVVRGYEDGSFRPGAPVTRAEAVTMALRMLDVLQAEVDPSTRLLLNGQPTEYYAAVYPKYGRGLAPLKPMAVFTGLDVNLEADGWYRIAWDDVWIRVKAGVPYALTGDGRRVRLEVAPPVQIGGELYLPDLAFNLLGLSVRWDQVNGEFDIVTQ